MQIINFVLAHMYHVQYFIPLIMEANKRGIKSKVFTFYIEADWEKGKNSSVHPYRYIDYIKEIAKKYDFDFNLCNDANEIEGLTFFGEKRGLSNILTSNKKTHKVILTRLIDFNEPYGVDNWYDNYIDKVDNVIFISKFFAKYYKKVSDKNLYLGSPKYDIVLDKELLKKKYDVQSDKNVLIFLPELQYMKKINLKEVYRILRDMGYSLMGKGRAKDSAPSDLRPDQYFEDTEWFPHASMELIEIADMVINFESAVTKECVMLDTPFINFRIGMCDLPFPFLYDYGCCRNLNVKFSLDKFETVVNEIFTKSSKEDFQEIKSKHLSEGGNASKRILDALL